MCKPFLSLVLLASLSVSSCSTMLNNLPGVYTIDIQQGNMIDQSMVDQLRPNMTKRQVLFIMGSPMLKDSFQKNRWDYLYSNQPGGEPRLQKRISLYFQEDKIVGIQGDFRPSTLPVIKPSEETTVDVPKRKLDKTLWGMITGWFDFDDSETGSPESDQNREEADSQNHPKNDDNNGLP
ncbi:MAG: outer membrane protein assembly factor BamE [Gammaproteobacteria bacterium]